MTQFRNLVAVLFGILAIYTIFVVIAHGANFVPIYLGDIASVSWRGQINIDFTSYLILAAIWIAWRHEFSAKGCILAAFALIFALLVFAPYLLWAIARANGDPAVLLLGEARAASR